MLIHQILNHFNEVFINSKMPEQKKKKEKAANALK